MTALSIVFSEQRWPAADDNAAAWLDVQCVADGEAKPEQSLAQFLAHPRCEGDRGHPFTAELDQFCFGQAQKLGQRRQRRIGFDAAVMSAAATWAIGAEHHVAELDRVERVVLDRIIHPGAGDALADEDEQMRIAERIVFGAATVKGGVRHHRIGEGDRHAREQFAEHVADTSDVAGNDRIAELA